MARKFLYGIAGLLSLAVVLGIGYRLFEPQLWRAAFVPSVPFDANAAGPALDYRLQASWLAHPGGAEKAAPKTAAADAPPGYLAAPLPAADVFYVGPSTFTAKTSWNARPGDPASRADALMMVRHEASLFNGVARVWSPATRQASFGAFLTPSADAPRAIALAYTDVTSAFAAFQQQRDARRPFILAGHGQGAAHVLRLLAEPMLTVARPQLVAAYVIGWPVSVEADLSAAGLAVCQTPTATGCLISWSSFGPDVDPAARIRERNIVPTLSGRPRAGTRTACVNPLTFWASAEVAPAAVNQGALPFVAAALPLPALVTQASGAVCTADGLLTLTTTPAAPFDARVMPGSNYQDYDITLFWANLRNNAEARVQTFLTPK